ncbi:MAG: dephospho-CoA kinase [Pseudomonadota bacterium]
MITFGLTGSIGMGKTTAGQMLEYLGCPVHDSDASVKAALEPHGKAFEAVALTFPKSWDKKKRVLKKDYLSRVIFSDPHQKKKLENILHPIVRAEQKEFIFRQQRLGRNYCVLDIPLLFETNGEERVDKVILVTAPYFIQRSRVLSRDGMSEEKFHKILNNQMNDLEKRARSDYIVQTGLGKAYTMRELKQILKAHR